MYQEVRDISLAVRFNAKFVVRADGCWEWTAARNSYGYGLIKYQGKPWAAHRFAYEQLVGPIPEGKELDHLCRNRACVRPGHLEPVTHLENCLRGGNRMKTHCPQGHPYSGANLHERRGVRLCRTCNRERTQRLRRTARVAV